jgi:cellulose synthase (UDP-forming)
VLIGTVLILSASAIGFFLWLALLIEKRTWGGPIYYPKSHLERKPLRISELFARFTAAISIAYTLYYLFWRLSILNPQAMWLSWLLWGAEAYGFVTLFLFSFMTWRLHQPSTPAASPNLSVDVFVPTLGEPIDILRATLVGCVHIEYPHQTFVLDDSARSEVEALAVSLGCNYISRPTHEGAKAGNLNHALKRTRSEFVVVLDADHVPLPDFLHNTLGFFDDMTVAAVQGPQLFYNLDSFQHEDSSWHEQRVFFHVIQPGKNRTNSAFWCGSPAVLRRSAIEAIGGVAQETVTEDLHTTIRLIKHGYHVVYTERPLAAGLSPATINDYLGQRFRWGQGAMQVLRSKDSPIWTKGLTISQRLNFVASTITYFDGLQILILLAIPIITLITGLLPISMVGSNFIARFIPYLALIFLTNIFLGRGNYDFWHIERYSLLRAFTFTSTLPTLITGKALPFYVTKKEAGEGMGSLSRGRILPHLVTLGLCIAAVIIGFIHIFHPIWYQQGSFPLAIVIMWTLINIILLTEGMSRLLGISHRTRYRFPVITDIQWRRSGNKHWKKGHSLNLSATGIYFEHHKPELNQGDHVEIAISAVTQSARSTDNQDVSPLLADRSRVLLAGHVINREGVSDQTHQRVGIFIDKFASESDANRYFYLTYSPINLLHGEEIFHPSKSKSS